MEKNNQNNPQNLSNQDQVKFVALGGLEDVTRNLYLYEYKDEILIVDCGLGFPDETMLGVDLLLPDITYLLDEVQKRGKRIVGMFLTHGHEDHIGGTPFILPQLMDGKKTLPFNVYASPLTAALTNEKMKEFNLPIQVQTVEFSDSEVNVGSFSVNFIRVTHSVPDSANFFIKTPAGNFFHGSDFKFDLTPHDGKRTEFEKINKAAQEGVICLMSDCLGSDRSGHSLSEKSLTKNFERVMLDTEGKFIITTYSSNIARLNQVIEASEKLGRKVCFVGRSVHKVKEVGMRLGYFNIKPNTEIDVKDVGKYKSNQLTLVVAGSQGQENSAMTRIANGEHREIRLDPQDSVVFSSEIIPGNEIAVSSLVNAIAKKGAKVVTSDPPGSYHVSGHGSEGDHELLAALLKPRFLLPISGTYKHMNFYREMAIKMGYARKDVFLVENGQEMMFEKNRMRLGKKAGIKNVFVDQVSGEEVDSFVIRDRTRLAKEGMVIVMAEVRASDGQLAEKPIVVTRGATLADSRDLSDALGREIDRILAEHKDKVNNWVHVRKLVNETAQKFIFKKYRSRPLVMPVVIEV